MDKESEKIVGIRKPTYEELESKYGRMADRCEYAEKLNKSYEELESEYGRMADRCEYAEKLNKSLERVIVEKDNTIETLTREIENYNAIGRENQNIIHALTDENCELKKELEKAKKEQIDILNDCKFKLNSIYDVYDNDILDNSLGSKIKIKLCEEVKSNDNGDTQ